MPQSVSACLRSSDLKRMTPTRRASVVGFREGYACLSGAALGFDNDRRPKPSGKIVEREALATLPQIPPSYRRQGAKFITFPLAHYPAPSS